MAFLIGPKKEVYHVHQNLVCFFSEPFKAMLKWDMKEKTEREVNLPEVDVEIFDAFVDLLYSCHDKLEKINSGLLWMPSTRYLRAWNGVSVAKDYSMFIFAKPCEFGKALFDDTKLIRDPFDLDGQERIEAEFLFEALEHYRRLYIFADMYMVRYLDEICLHRIRRLLSVAPPTNEMYSGILEMVPSIWTNTLREDDLRQLWLEFILVNPIRYMYQKGSDDLEPSWEEALEVDEFAADFLRAAPRCLFSKAFRR